MLLGRGGVHPNRAAESGQTPLMAAALREYEGVVNTLLELGNIKTGCWAPKTYITHAQSTS